MKDWGWPLLLVLLFLATVLLIVLRAFGVIDWPWWAALIPGYALVALIAWALVGLDRMMQEVANEPATDAPWFEFVEPAHVDDH